MKFFHFGPSEEEQEAKNVSREKLRGASMKFDEWFFKAFGCLPDRNAEIRLTKELVQKKMECGKLESELQMFVRAREQYTVAKNTMRFLSI